jgi:putative ABC transport system permease protein
MSDFHFTSMHDPIKPLCLINDQTLPSHFSLRISGNRVGETTDYIQKTWKEICPEYPLVYEFYDDWFNSMYNKEEKLGKLLSVFTILAIIISSLGIWGMAYFSCEGRIKEICIRKIQGARISSIFFMLSREFILLVFISVILAGPVAWYIMNKWLDNFAYKIPVTIWYFVTAGAVALAVACIAVSYHTLKAALKNPVEALRYE